MYKKVFTVSCASNSLSKRSGMMNGCLPGCLVAFAVAALLLS